MAVGTLSRGGEEIVLGVRRESTRWMGLVFMSPANGTCWPIAWLPEHLLHFPTVQSGSAVNPLEPPHPNLSYRCMRWWRHQRVMYINVLVKECALRSLFVFALSCQCSNLELPLLSVGHREQDTWWQRRRARNLSPSPTAYPFFLFLGRQFCAQILLLHKFRPSRVMLDIFHFKTDFLHRVTEIVIYQPNVGATCNIWGCGNEISYLRCKGSHRNVCDMICFKNMLRRKCWHFLLIVCNEATVV